LLALQFLANGLLTGGVYALIAVSIVLIYKSTRIFNFAVGDLLTLGGFTSYSFVMWYRFPFWLAMLSTLIMAVFIGGLVERLVLRPLLSQPILTIIMATLALSSLLNALILMIWSGYTVTFPPNLLPGKTLIISGIALSHDLLWSFSIAMLSFVILAYFFKKTRTGLRMRSVSEASDLAMSCGVNIVFIYAISWMIAVAMGCISGFLLGNRIGLTAGITPLVALRAFPAVLFGGLESVPGAVVGGLTIGIIEGMVGGLIDPNLGEISPYIILLFMLIIRPEGLFGLKRIERI
jgi:branched-chain amino acid transport system permease protein